MSDRLHRAAQTIRTLSPERHSLAEVLAVLFHNHHLRHDPKNPNWPGRDHLIVASPSLRPTWFAALTSRGVISEDELESHRKAGFVIHDRQHRTFSGSLRAAIDLARSTGTTEGGNHVFIIIDGADHHLGDVWEFADQVIEHRLTNITVIADVATELLETGSPIHNFAKRWLGFGWKVAEVDGHTIPELNQALLDAKKTHEPTIIIAYTKERA